MDPYENMTREELLDAVREERDFRARVEANWDFYRREFIRETAQLMYVFRKRDEGSAFQPADAWTHAKALWEAKPEDC
jgi:hypothetical protein